MKRKGPKAIEHVPLYKTYLKGQLIYIYIYMAAYHEVGDTNLIAKIIFSTALLQTIYFLLKTFNN